MLGMAMERLLNIRELARKKSIFLFGPRSTGKTTLLRMAFGAGPIINLLRSSTFLPLSENPSLLRDVSAERSTDDEIVIIDEIQKLPELLDEVHDLIESRGYHFILTGSSGRKLKRSGVNLLAGRAWESHLFPLTTAEIPDFDIARYLRYGGMPQVYGSDLPDEELDAYVDSYLREEIKEEALVQNLVHFGRFLNVAVLSNTEQINYANISRQTGIPATSVRAYFDILEDSFVGYSITPWTRSQKRKSVATAKFYFFDVGVANFLRGITSLDRGSSELGRAFEHFVAMELRAYLSYRRIRSEMTYWRTRTGYEVDFIIGSEAAIEVKATVKVDERDLRGLRALGEEGIVKTLYVVSFDELDRKTEDGIRVLHWRRFLDLLWSDRIVGGLTRRRRES